MAGSNRTTFNILPSSMAAFLRTKTGFLDLPPEVRQMVYDHFRPPDHLPTFNTILRLYQADPFLAHDFLFWIRTKRGLRIVIAPEKPLPPLWLIKYMRHIEIFIDHYAHDHVEASVQELHAKLTRLTAAMARCTRLQKLTVVFRDDVKTDRDVMDRSWCRPESYCDYHCIDGSDSPELEETGCVFTTVDHHVVGEQFGQMPIVEYLLRPLLNLPVIDQVSIEDVWGLMTSPGPAFDQLYMFDLFADVESWIQGCRSGGFLEPEFRLAMRNCGRFA